MKALGRMLARLSLVGAGVLGVVGFGLWIFTVVPLALGVDLEHSYPRLGLYSPVAWSVVGGLATALSVYWLVRRLDRPSRWHLDRPYAPWRVATSLLLIWGILSVPEFFAFNSMVSSMLDLSALDSWTGPRYQWIPIFVPGFAALVAGIAMSITDFARRGPSIEQPPGQNTPASAQI